MYFPPIIVFTILDEEVIILLDDKLVVRVSAKAKRKFVKGCKSMDREYQCFIREIIAAFNEGRLKIQPKKGNIYD